MSSMITVGGYAVDAALHGACVAAFDLWRDGLGKFKGDLGRAAFLRGTSDIVGRFVPDGGRADPWLRSRHLRALRAELAARPRKSDRKILVVES